MASRLISPQRWLCPFLMGVPSMPKGQTPTKPFIPFEGLDF